MKLVSNRIESLKEKVQVLELVQNVQCAVMSHFAQYWSEHSWIEVQELLKLLKECEDKCLNAEIMTIHEFELFIKESVIAVFSSEQLCECIREAADIDTW
jgi:hypothetical protein